MMHIQAREFNVYMPRHSSPKQEEEEEEEEQNAYFKPMSKLSVCPAAASASSCAVAIPVRTESQEHFHPTLRRAPITIRYDYLNQLGIGISTRNVEKCTKLGQKRQQLIKENVVKMKLNDVEDEVGNRNAGSSLFSSFAKWVVKKEDPVEEEQEEDEDDLTSDEEFGLSSSATTSVSSSICSSEEFFAASSSPPAEMKKKVLFHHEAEVLFIPAHREYSKSQRNGMWHTREEFYAMVEGNLDAMYEEMEQEYERQCECEQRELEDMAREELQQRKFENTRKIMNNNNMLVLCPVQTAIKKAKRSDHDIRFKYLKNLGFQH